MNLATLTSDLSHRFDTLTRTVQRAFPFIRRRQPLSDRPIRGVILTTGQLEERRSEERRVGKECS